MSSSKKLIDVSGFYAINFFDISPTFQTDFHNHEQWELFYVDAGEANCIVEGESRILKKGDIIFHSPGEIHNTVSDEKKVATIFNVLFYCDSPAMEFFRGKLFKISEKAASTLKLLMDECNETYLILDSPISLRDSSPIGGEQMSLLLFEEFLLLLIRDLSGDRSKTIRNRSSINVVPIVNEMCEYMRKSLYGRLTLSDLCENFHFSRSFLCDVFKKHVGCAPIDYYLELKLTEAKRLLREDGLSVKEISERLGFESTEYFSRYFKKRVGHSPRDFRKMLINDIPLVKKNR